MTEKLLLTNFIALLLSLSPLFAQVEIPQEKLTADDFTLGLWHLDEVTGFLTPDASKNGCHGKLVKGKDSIMPNLVKGKFGKALAVDKLSGLMVEKSHVFHGLSALTVECHVYFNSLGEKLKPGKSNPNVYNTIIWKGYSFFLRINSNANSLQFNVVVDGDNIAYASVNSGPIETGKWYHLVGIYDGKKVYLIVNGKVTQGKAASGDVNINPSKLMIGSDLYRQSHIIIDEVRISNVARYIAPLPKPGSTSSPLTGTNTPGHVMPDVKMDKKDLQKMFASLTLGLDICKRHGPSTMGSVLFADSRHMREFNAADSTLSPAEIERSIIIESVNSIPLVSTSPSRWPNLKKTGGHTIENRIAQFLTETMNEIGDLKRNYKTLKKYGFEVDVSFEIKRIKSARKILTKLSVDRYYEQLISFYRQVAIEKFKLTANILTYQRMSTYLLKTVKLQLKLARIHEDTVKEIEVDLKSLDQEIVKFSELCKKGNYSAAFGLDLSLKKSFEQLRDKIAIGNNKSYRVYPGASFKSTGRFAEGGIWQGLLSFEAAQGQIYRSSNKVKLYSGDFSSPWAFNFEPPDAKCTGYEPLGSTWGFQRNRYTYQENEGGGVTIQDVIWTTLSPGILINTKGKKMELMDTTLGNAHSSSPDKIICLYNNQPRVITRNEGLKVGNISEGWLLLVWEHNTPLFPVLVVFDKKPDKFIWTKSSFIVESKDEVGRSVIGLPYGAAPQPPSFAKELTDTPSDELIDKCRKFAQLLLYFPYDIDEYYSVEKNKIRIWNNVTKAAKITNAWNLKYYQYTPLPPMYGLARDFLDDVTTKEKLVDYKVPTKYGPYYGVAGDWLEYTIPRARMWDRHELLPDKNTDMVKDMHKKIWRLSGGNNPKNHAEFNRWSLINTFNAGWCMFETSLKEKMESLYKQDKNLQPFFDGTGVDKVYLMWKENFNTSLSIDSTSGKSFWLKGWRGYRHGTNTRGDVPNFAGMALSGMYTYAKLFGRWPLIEKNYEEIKNIYSSLPARQLWATPTHDCMTSGCISKADMLGDAWRAHHVMAFISRVLKKRYEEELAIYLGSKTMATIGVMMHPYLKYWNASIENQSAQKPKAYARIGVQDDGMQVNVESFHGWPYINSLIGCHDFDYPIFDGLFQFFPKSVAKINENFEKMVPRWDTLEYQYQNKNEENSKIHKWVQTSQAFGTLKLKVWLGDDPILIRKLYNKMNVNYFHFYHVNFLCNALPNVIAQDNPVYLAEWDKAYIISGKYDSQKQAASIVMRSPRPANLSLVSKARPAKIDINGNTLSTNEYSYSPASRELIINFGLGQQKIEIYYPDYDPVNFRKPDFTKQKLGVKPEWRYAPKPGDWNSKKRLPGTISFNSLAFKGGQQHKKYSYACQPKDAHFIKQQPTKQNTAVATFKVSKQDMLVFTQREANETENLFNKNAVKMFLIITGQDHDKDGGKTKVEILLNGETIYKGANQCAKKGWSDWKIPIGLESLKLGENTFVVKNLTKEFIKFRDWFAVNSVVIKIIE
jgi:concanavalin A-like lectin/glucanase superfamily protein